jgi:hypothetical protein
MTAAKRNVPAAQGALIPQCQYHPSADCTACPECLARLNAEHSALNDRYMRLLRDQSQFGRDVRAAAQSEAQREIYDWGDRWADAHIAAAERDVTWLAEQVTRVIPDDGGRISAADAWELRRLASAAAARLKETKPPETIRDDAARAELTRLREVVTAMGRRMHAEHPDEDRMHGCHCQGCELIRGMDAGREDAPEDPADTDGLVLIKVSVPGPEWVRRTDYDGLLALQRLGEAEARARIAALESRVAAWIRKRAGGLDAPAREGALAAAGWIDQLSRTHGGAGLLDADSAPAEVTR